MRPESSSSISASGASPPTCSSSAKVASGVRTVDRLGRPQERRTLSDDAQISVLAGNYTSVNDPAAIETLRWVKRFSPPSFGDKAIYRKDGNKGAAGRGRS